MKKGTIFLLGRHRLLYGDALSFTNVEKLMDGKKADMCFTDPPYGIDYNPDDRPIGGRARSKNKLGKIIGDTKGGDTEFNLDKFLQLLETGLIKGAVYICGSDEMHEPVFKWSLKTFKRIPTDIIWVKNYSAISRRDYNRQYEHIYYVYFQGKKWRGSDGDGDVWFISRRNVAKYLHPTQKPLMLVKKAILNSSDEGDIVLDLFGGGGTTLIACEQTNRICFMAELDERYINVIINRWEADTKERAKILGG
jgi:DNA modification methylase